MIGTLHEKSYPAHGLTFVSAFYTGLAYGDNGGLAITREHHAVDPAEAAARCRRAITEGLVRSVGGKNIRVRADSVCVHSDTPNAVEIATAVQAAVAPYLTAA